jgi:transcriptional regulator with XRE-family HTH domain
MTQQDLAEKIGVSRQTVNAIETGKYWPSLEVAFRIAIDRPGRAAGCYSQRAVGRLRSAAREPAPIHSNRSGSFEPRLPAVFSGPAATEGGF